MYQGVSVRDRETTHSTLRRCVAIRLDIERCRNHCMLKDASPLHHLVLLVSVMLCKHSGMLFYFVFCGKQLRGIVMFRAFFCQAHK